MKLKKFNLEIALKDPSQIVRGDGRQVIYISKKEYDGMSLKYPLAVCIKYENGDLDVQSYTEEGIFSTSNPGNTSQNLFLKSKETTYWYNIYKNNATGRVNTGDLYFSPEDAASEIYEVNSTFNSTFIKTESFTIEE